MSELREEVAHLRRQVRWMRLYTVVSSLMVLGLALTAFSRTPPVNHPAAEIIRARAIIIEDSLGRDRILIGAPIPYTDDRVRTDTMQVRKSWASRLGGARYMERYREYMHGTNGMVVLNDRRFDELLVGDQLADPNTGKRNGEHTGVLWNDEEGFERGGLGLNRLRSSGAYRNGIGFDDEEGEALHLMLLEDGSRLLRLGGPEGYAILGTTSSANEFFQTKSAFGGIRRFDSTGTLLWEHRWSRASR